MWAKYKNGNYDVAINLGNGTKVRYNDLDNFQPSRPESMDIKISNQCDMMCEFCHENSTPNGKLADIMSYSFIDNLLPYTECALGGGNILSRPDLIPFLEKCKELKLISSGTVNQKHFMQNVDLLKNLCDDKMIYGLGVSLTDPTDEFIKAIEQIPNAVIHIINGVANLECFEKLAHKDLKILILGYKNFRRGEVFYSNHSEAVDVYKQKTYELLPKMIEEGWFSVVSFDNLAIEQLEPQRCMSEEQWNEFYMWDDFEYTFYVDMVEKKFAGSSTCTERYDLLDDPIEMFNIVRENRVK